MGEYISFDLRDKVNRKIYKLIIAILEGQKRHLANDKSIVDFVSRVPGDGRDSQGNCQFPKLNPIDLTVLNWS